MTKAARLSVAILAAALIVPAALFFLSAVGRSLQPTNHEPSRTLDTLVRWFLGLDGTSLLTLLVLLPLVALVVAAVLLWNAWTSDPTLRSDMHALVHAVLPFAHRPALLVSALVVMFGAIYFAAMLVHGLAG